MSSRTATVADPSVPTVGGPWGLAEVREELRAAGFPLDQNAGLVWASSGRHDVAVVDDPVRGPIFVKRRGAPLAPGGQLPDLGMETYACRMMGAEDLLGMAVPEVLLTTPNHHLFVTRGYSEHRTLSELAANAALDTIDPVRLGALVARIHSVPAPEWRQFPQRGMQLCTHGSVSPAEFLARPGSFADYLRRVQPRISGQVRDLRERWQPSAVVHGDLAAQNILVATPPLGPPMVVTDWELAGVGDPARDLGTLMGSVLWAVLVAGNPPADSASGSVYHWLRDLIESYRSNSACPPDLALVFQWAGHWFVERVFVTLPPRGGLSSDARRALLIAENLLEK